MERDRISLIQKTFRTLNSYYYRNQNMNSSSSVPPLAVQRVKVTFKDEPGEGSGVARSFYSSIVEVSKIKYLNIIFKNSFSHRQFYLMKNYLHLNWVHMVLHQLLNQHQDHYPHMHNGNNVHHVNVVQH